MNQSRDNFKAGLFVLTGIVLAVIVIFTLADLPGLLERQQEVRVYLRLSDGLQGLKQGAAATLGDQPVGSVVTIDDHVGQVVLGDQPTPAVLGKVVTIRLPARYDIYWNADIELVAPPLGSGTRLNIRSVGHGQRYVAGESIPADAIPDSLVDAPGGDKLAAYEGPHDAIPGNVGGSLLTRNLVQDMGIEDLQRQQLRQIIANVAVLTETLKDDVPQITASARGVIERLDPLAVDASEAVRKMHAAADDVNAMTAALRGSSPQWIERIDSVTKNTDVTVAGVRQLLADKDPALRQTVDNLHAVTGQVREQHMAQFTAALEEANAALTNVRAASLEVRALITGQRPVLERAIANAQLTTDQLKLAAIEVRRSPWRLLYKPSDEELETDNLYDATRSFSLAAGALDAAAQSLHQFASQQPDDAEQIQPMLDHLEQLFTRFEEAEASFWEALKKN